MPSLGCTPLRSGDRFTDTRIPLGKLAPSVDRGSRLQRDVVAVRPANHGRFGIPLIRVQQFGWQHVVRGHRPRVLQRRNRNHPQRLHREGHPPQQLIAAQHFMDNVCGCGGFALFGHQRTLGTRATGCQKRNRMNLSWVKTTLCETRSLTLVALRDRLRSAQLSSWASPMSSPSGPRM